MILGLELLAKQVGYLNSIHKNQQRKFAEPCVID